MAPSSHSLWSSLIILFLLFLSLSGIATTSPVPNGNSTEILVQRTMKPPPGVDEKPKRRISEVEYERYIKKHWPQTNQYLFYSGNSQRQVERFKEHNPGYVYYDDIFNTNNNPSHPWYSEWNEDEWEDDGDASSRALAKTVTGDVRVLGAVEHATKGQNSYFHTKEVGILRDRMGTRESDVRSINHMALDAIDPLDVAATEDRHGTITWTGRKPEYKAGYSNYGPGRGPERDRRPSPGRGSSSGRFRTSPDRDWDRWCTRGLGGLEARADACTMNPSDPNSPDAKPNTADPNSPMRVAPEDPAKPAPDSPMRVAPGGDTKEGAPAGAPKVDPATPKVGRPGRIPRGLKWLTGSMA